MMSHASPHETLQWILITFHMTHEILNVLASLYSLNSPHTLLQPICRNHLFGFSIRPCPSYYKTLAYAVPSTKTTLFHSAIPSRTHTYTHALNDYFAKLIPSYSFMFQIPVQWFLPQETISDRSN